MLLPTLIAFAANSILCRLAFERPDIDAAGAGYAMLPPVPACGAGGTLRLALASTASLGGIARVVPGWSNKARTG